MSQKTVFLIFFLFAIVVGGILQKVIIPATPWHAGHGLLEGGDWCWFHDEAVKLALQIKMSGWSKLQFHPKGNSPIAIAGALYYLTGIHEPWIVLPINGVLYGIAAVVLFNLFVSLSGHMRIAWIALVPLVFPSTAMIWGQIHKDIWMLPGSFMVLRFWVELSKREVDRQECLKSFALLAFGILGVWIARPYATKIFFVAEILAASCLLIVKTCDKSLSKLTVLFLGCGLALQVPFLVVEDNIHIVEDRPLTNVPPSIKSQLTWNSSSLPQMIDKQLQKMADSRERFRFSYPEAASNIDVDVAINSGSKLLKYIPRALEVGLLAPFPSMWFSAAKSPGGNWMRSSAGLEMLICYIAFLGWLGFLRPGNRKLLGKSLPSVVCCLAILTVYSLVVCNVGTLYRMRYPMMCYLMMIGWIGWQEGILKLNRRA